MPHSIIRAISTDAIHNFVAAFESGRVQKYPQARFVNRYGECCLVGALAGARTAADVVRSPLWRDFIGSPLEELSRRFEARRLTAQEFYEECLLALAARQSAIPAAALV